MKKKKKGLGKGGGQSCVGLARESRNRGLYVRKVFGAVRKQKAKQQTIIGRMSTPIKTTGPIMLVTTNTNNHKDDPKAKRSKSRTGGGSKKETDAPIIVDGVLERKKKKSGKSGKRGGGGGGGGNNTGTGAGAGSRRQAGCMSLEEMFHIVFLSIAVGFLLVYLREVTIVSYNSKKKAEKRGRFEWWFQTIAVANAGQAGSCPCTGNDSRFLFSSSFVSFFFDDFFFKLFIIFLTIFVFFFFSSPSLL